MIFVNVYLTISHPFLWEGLGGLQYTFYGFNHSLALNVIQEAFNHIGETMDGVEIAVLAPDPVGCKNTLCHLASIASSPELCEEIHDLLVVVWLDRCTISACTAFVVGDDGCKTEYESLWKLALTLEIYLDSWKVACLELRE